jgi:hypothetical protein
MKTFIAILTSALFVSSCTNNSLNNDYPSSSQTGTELSAIKYKPISRKEIAKRNAFQIKEIKVKF